MNLSVVADKRPAQRIRVVSVVQLSWLLFAAIASSLALAGMRPYTRRMGIACDGTGCLPGQLNSAEAAAALRTGLALVPDYAPQATAFAVFPAVLCVVLAAFCVWRRPASTASLLAAFVLTAFGTRDFVQALAWERPWLRLPHALVELVYLAGLAPCLLLVVDEGRRRPWLWAAAGVSFAGALVVSDAGSLSVRAGYSLAVLAFVGSLIIRYRAMPPSSSPSRRAWVLVAVALLTGAQLIGRPLRPLPLPAIPFTAAPQGPYLLVAIHGMLLLIGAIACLAAALLYDELFHVELVLNRALVYGLLSLFVVGGYVLVVGYLSVIFQARGSLWFSLVATGVVAALFQPLREQVQRTVNQMLYGQRHDPAAVVSELGQRLEASLAPESVLPTVVETVATTLKAPFAAIVLKRGDALVNAATYGTAAHDEGGSTFPLVYQGIEVGGLVVAPRAGESELSKEDRRLLAQLARQASVAAYAVRLTDELRRSREQLVLAREEERRRLRRDLHDGLGPTLASQALTIDTIGLLLDRDPGAAAALVREVKAQSQAAVAEVRRVVYALRPPALDDLGLLGALREQVSWYMASGVELRLETPDVLPPLPAAVEVAAYQIVREALTNVVRHARACHCSVTLAIDDCLSVAISDDGRGTAFEQRAGVGLASMRERVEELGGMFGLESEPGKGTRVHVTLPLMGEHGPCRRLTS